MHRSWGGRLCGASALIAVAMGVADHFAVWKKFCNFVAMKHIAKFISLNCFSPKRVLLVIAAFFALSTSSFAQISVRATKYHPGRRGVGHVTASGDRINMKKLRNYEIRWVAMSPDLFRNHGFKLGDTIKVTCKNPKVSGLWVIKDRMSKRMHNYLDFLVPYGDHYNFHAPMTVQIEKM